MSRLRLSAEQALHRHARQAVEDWLAPDDSQEALRAAFLHHLDSHDDAPLRSCVPAHITASALVLDHTGERVLLTLHRKGGFWGQLGGHCEPGDVTLANAALREATEESGIEGIRLACDGPIDLDRHRLSSAFGSCGEHLDVRYAVVAPPGAAPVVSDESDDVAWFAADALPPESVHDLSRLVARARAALAERSTAASAAQSSESPSPAVAETPSR